MIGRGLMRSGLPGREPQRHRVVADVLPFSRGALKLRPFPIWAQSRSAQAMPQSPNKQLPRRSHAALTRRE
jgi:hypothetical protein